MRKNQWFASVVLSVLISASGMAYAHDGGPGQDGGKPWHHEDCGNKPHFTDAQRKLLHETMKKTFEQDKALIGKLHDLHKKLHDVVAAPHFDAGAFESLTTQIQETHDKIHADRTHAFASIAGQFSPQEREMLIHMGKHHHGHHDGDHAGWQGQHGDHGGPGNWHGHEWQSQQQPSSNDVTWGQVPSNNDYPPYNK